MGKSSNDNYLCAEPIIP
jgi:U3 small nucleolar RNA-associated protein 14